ncbi:MAG: hypothetical protein OXC37_00115 [Bdellovibrionaceae bacterium]|nr:hypothetical protein [Pseudobdellovibrionaceae bacterium]
MFFKFFILLFSLVIIASCDSSESCQELLDKQKLAKKAWEETNSKVLSAKKTLKIAEDDETKDNAKKDLDDADNTELETIKNYKIAIENFNSQCLRSNTEKELTEEELTEEPKISSSYTDCTLLLYTVDQAKKGWKEKQKNLENAKKYYKLAENNYEIAKNQGNVLEVYLSQLGNNMATMGDKLGDAEIYELAAKKEYQKARNNFNSQCPESIQ